MILMVLGWGHIIAIVLAAIYFYHRVANVKIGRCYQIIAIILLVAAACAAYMIESVLIRVVSLILFQIVFITVVFDCKKIQAAYWSSICLIVNVLVDNGAFGLYFLFAGEGLGDPRYVAQIRDPGFSVHNVLLGYTVAFIMFVIFHLTTVRHSKRNTIDSTESIYFSLIIFSLIPINIWIPNSGMLLEIYTLRYLLIASSFSSLIIIVSFFKLYNNMIAKSEERLQLQLEAKTYQLTKEHMAQITNTYEKMSGLKHDLNNHFTAISGYLENNELDILKDYVSKLTKNNTVPAIYSKNPVLNALISAKSEMAKNNNIKFTVETALPNPLPVSDIELCILVGNLLDNAFEAQEKAEQQYYVDLKIQAIDAYLMISCTNKARITDSFTSFSNLESTKINSENPEAHGIGTKQIQKIAEGTGGYVRYKNENGEFEALVMLKM